MYPRLPIPPFFGSSRRVVFFCTSGPRYPYTGWLRIKKKSRGPIPPMPWLHFCGCGSHFCFEVRNTDTMNTDGEDTTISHSPQPREGELQSPTASGLTGLGEVHLGFRNVFLIGQLRLRTGNQRRLLPSENSTKGEAVYAVPEREPKNRKCSPTTCSPSYRWSSYEHCC